jgi:CDGSH-type Zn-finger protein
MRQLAVGGTLACIVCGQHGPYCVSETFTVKDAQGDEYECFRQDTVYLCLRSDATNKPFCNRSHEERGCAG